MDSQGNVRPGLWREEAQGEGFGGMQPAFYTHARNLAAEVREKFASKGTSSPKRVKFPGNGQFQE